MRGRISKGLRSGSEYGKYLEQCSHGYGEYLQAHGGGVITFTRYVHGVESDSHAIGPDGLALMLDGRDPDSGAELKAFREGQVRYYEFPVNDTKLLDVAGVRFPDVREARAEAQAAGEKAVREYVTAHATVRIRVGDNLRKWVRADEVMWASAVHETSREGDPHLHRHLIMANRVRVGAKWYAVDSVKLFGMYENIRSVYETTVYGDPHLRTVMARHGLTLHLDGTVPEIEGADKVFSKRTAQVDARLAELIGQWRSDPKREYREVRDADGNVVGHTGYETVPDMPDDKTLAKLKLQAWHETRRAKGEWNTRVDWTAWDAELRAAGWDLDRLPGSGSVAAPVRAEDVDDLDAELAALRAVNALQEHHSAWSLEQLEVAVYDQVRVLDVTGTRGEIAALAGRIMAKAMPLCTTLSDDPRAKVPWARNLSTNAVAECETDLRGRLAARGALDTLPTPDVTDIAREHTLDKGQTEALATVAKGDPLTVVEGVAGAGKTHMLKAVREYVETHDGRLLLATPTRKGAQSAAGEVGVGTMTVMKLLEAYGYRHDETDPVRPWRRVRVGQTDHRGNPYRGVPAEYRMDGRTCLTVDEAGMLDQDQTRALLHIADETGARLVLVGDRSQLSSVGRGGVLDMAARYTGNRVVMTDPHRFLDPSYAGFTIRLHDHGPDRAEDLADEMESRGMVHRYGDGTLAVDAIAREWMTNPDTVVSTGTNADADMLNAAIQRARSDVGQLGVRYCRDMVEGETVREGDRVMTRRNDSGTGVANRELWTVERIDADGGMLVRGDDGRRTRLDGDYVRDAVQLGYAATVYGVQGMTARHAICYLGDGMDGAAMYVALTRGKRSNSLYLAADSDGEAHETLVRALGRDHADRGLETAWRDVRDLVDHQAEPGPGERLDDEFLWAMSTTGPGPGPRPGRYAAPAIDAPDPDDVMNWGPHGEWMGGPDTAPIPADDPLRDPYAPIPGPESMQPYPSPRTGPGLY